MDDEVLRRVEGVEKLTALFSGWPSFHDAEVLHLSFDLDTGLDGLEPSPSVESRYPHLCDDAGSGRAGVLRPNKPYSRHSPIQECGGG
jgi:hypothetical protein